VCIGLVHTLKSDSQYVGSLGFNLAFNPAMDGSSQFAAVAHQLSHAEIPTEFMVEALRHEVAQFWPRKTADYS